MYLNKNKEQIVFERSTLNDINDNKIHILYDMLKIINPSVR